ncbi:MAG: DUF2125 domain-containing protein [Alphaproteobacteria bacterium]
MRRIATVVLVLLLVVIGAYTALWFFIAHRMADEIAQWAARERPDRLDVSWDTLRVRGYPLAFRIEASGIRFRDLMPGRAIQARVPLLKATARPWDFRSWAIDVPGGLSATIGPAETPRARLTVQTVAGEAVIDAESDIAVTLDLTHPVFDAGERIAARAATISVAVPPEPPRTHTEPALSLAVEAADVQLPKPVIPAPFRDTLDTLEFDLTVLGPVPNRPPRQTAEAWRDAGGTMEIEKIAARSGDLAIEGSGTFAFDRELQPEAAFSGSVQGYDTLIAGLGEAGILPPGGSALARLGLSLFAKPGARGQPQIKTSFTIQDGEMALGPISLGSAPRIAWE